MKTDIKKALEMQTTIKEKHGNKVLTLFRNADEYELYSNDATDNYFVVGVNVQFSFVTYIQNEQTIMVARAKFKHGELDQVLPKIIRAGHRVCIVDAPVEYTTTNAR